MHRALCALVAAVLVTLAACSGESNDASASKERQRERREAAQRQRERRREQRKPRDPGCRFLVTAEGKRTKEAPPVLEYLSDAQAASSQCYDLVRFTFEPGDNNDLPPGYTVEYRKPPFFKDFQSTAEVTDEVKAILYVEFSFVSTFDQRQAGPGRNTYGGNQRLGLTPCCSGARTVTSEGEDAPDMHHTYMVEWLKDVEDPTPEVPTDDKVVWLIGLDRKRPFTVDASSAPPHVNILIMR